MLNKTIILLIIISLQTIGFTQDFAWVKTFGNLDPLPTYGDDLILDMNGNIFALGFLYWEIDMDPGINEYLVGGEYNSELNRIMFIQQLDKDGNFVDIKLIGGNGDCNGLSMKIDLQGNFYIFGSFYGNIDFDPNDGEHFLGGSNGSTFLLKLNSEREFLWVKNWNGIGIQGFDVDNIGNCYFTGKFNESVDFDPSINQNIMETSSYEDFDLYIMKILSDGNFGWAKKIDGSFLSMSTINNLAVDNSKIAISGSFEGTIDFNPDSGVYFLTSNNFNMYTLQLDDNGNFEWVRYLSHQESTSKGYSILSKYGYIYTVGTVSGEQYINPENESIFLSTGNENDYIIQKLDSLGNIEWIKTIKNTYYYVHFGGDIFLDSQSNFYMYDYFSDTTDFDPNDNIENLIVDEWRDNFILKLNIEGEFDWVKKIDLIMFSGLTNHHKAIAVDDDENIYTLGFFQNMADFDPSEDILQINAINGVGDMYVHKMSPCVNSRKDSLTTCIPYEWIDGNTYDESFIASFTIPNEATGCDSIITLDITFPDLIDITMSTDGTTITVAQSEAIYQWYECDYEFNSPTLVPIGNATEQSFTPNDENYYAVEVSYNDCNEISDCININYIGIDKTKKEKEVLLYPNPTTGTLSIKIPSTLIGNIIKIINPLGQIIKEIEPLESVHVLDLSNLSSGIYFVQLIKDSQVLQTKKLILE